MRAFVITISNYRSFPDSSPLRLPVRTGFTALVGPNNAGKSSAMRSFLELRPFLSTMASTEQMIRNLNGGGKLPLSMSGGSPSAAMHTRLNARPLEISVEVEHSPEEIAQKLITRAKVLIAPDTPTELMLFSGSERLGYTALGPTSTDYERAEPLADAFSILAHSLYVGPFRNALSVDASTPYYDLLIGRQFIEQFNTWKTGPNHIHNRKIRELTEDIRQAFGLMRLEVNASNDRSTFRVTADDETYSLAELGAGIAQFIIVLFSAALHEQRLIMIDEPELNLHPQLQMRFLALLGKYADSVLFATHVVGLARAAAEHRFTVGIADGVSRISPLGATPRLSELLGELSFSGRHDFGVNAVLLVEGASDVLVFQEMLAKVGKDHEVLVLPLGGAAQIHGAIAPQLEELKRITPKVYAIIDSERDAATKQVDVPRQAFSKACEDAQITCHILERRATENYLPERAIQAVKGRKYRALNEYEKLGDLQFAWAKSENYKIVSASTWNDFSATDLGRFIADMDTEK